MRTMTLRFVDPALERHYHDARLQFRLNAGRVSALAGVIAWLAFTILDSATIRDPSLPLYLFAAGRGRRHAGAVRRAADGQAGPLDRAAGRG